jgi:hypothetical protein
VYRFAPGETIVLILGAVLWGFVDRNPFPQSELGRTTILGFRFVRIGTKRPDGTARTERALGEANTAAVVLEEVAKTDALLFRDERCEVEFDLVWVRVLC